MARHFVRSFVIAAALSPFVNAGPCRPSSSSVAVVTTTAETSVATGSATTHTKDSSLTESLSEEATTTTETAATTSGEATTTGDTTATSEDTTAITEGATTTTEEATTTTEETTTTASETATGCVNNMERPTPEGAVCGARGYKDAQCSLYRGIEPAPTCSYDTSIINGGFDNGKFSPWQEDPNPGGKDPVALRPVPGGEGGTSYRLQTGQFDFDKSMWIYQDVKACPGTTFYCSYRWWWDEYYSIPQNSGGSLVPYVRVYQDDDRIGNRYPTSAAQTKTWINANFQFTMPDSGETRIWFVASSPQGEWINNSDDPCTPDWVHRPNSFALDSVYCRS
ncbi:hypothetical protein FOC4_g10005693 [Fusarium odoratissimum]|uniref:Uncharacterized protein n=1 Tax=Fusarium oxysporum f. sp. cubense (strain race 4) TaxID=2502994 RepID=N1RPR6_FUSC4|nr:hypothetical protein FOC4_g10005693 [Fusarium odoratissimum]